MRLSGWVVGVAAVVFGVVGMAQAGDWPQYRGVSQDGISSEKISKSWAAAGPKVVWKVPVGESFGSISVVGARAYLLMERSEKEVCVCLDARTGQELWAADIGRSIYEKNGGNGPRSTPVVEGGRVYVQGTWFKTLCLNAADGKMIWEKDLEKDFAGQVKTGGIKEWGSAMSPIVEGKLVLVAGGGPEQTILAFDKVTGEVVWKALNEKVTHATATPATILGVRQTVFFFQSGLVSVDPQDGKVLWRYAFPFSVSTAASPVVAGDIVYCSAGYGVGAGAVKISKAGEKFEATEIWRTKGTNINHWSTPIVKDGYIYGLFGFKEHGTCPLKCVELATGKELWSESGFGPGEVILVDGALLIQGDRGQMVLVDPNPKAYKEIARAQPLSAKCWTMPVVSNGRIYSRSVKEAVCLEAGGE